MLNSFVAFTSQQKLFSEKHNILLAVSGGIDSVVMCELFHQSKIKFGIAHCNFQLRAKESDGDSAFVKKLGDKYKVDFFSKKFETNKFSERSGISIQMAARDLRYNWLEETRGKNGFDCIAVAHHKDDSIETFFINLLRGTGIAGLHGILPKQGNIVRPLLFATRQEIESFYKRNKLKHREDSSNQSDKYLRNKIRHRIIPELKKINPNIEEIISKDIERIKDVEQIYLETINAKKNEILKKENGRTLISVNKLKQLNSLKTYLFEFLREFNFSSPVIEDIIESFKKQSGKKFYSSTHQLVKDRENLIISERNENIKKLNLSFSVKDKNKNFKFPVNKNIACLDHDLLQLPLKKRIWKRGDSFHPLGMKGKKKLSDFLVDNKISITDKEKVQVLLSGNQIVWVIGMRIDDRFKVTEKTKKIHICELIEE